MGFRPTTVMHPVGGKHTCDSEERLASFLASGWVLADQEQEPEKQPEKKPVKGRRKKGE